MYINIKTNQYPVSESDIRAAFPNVSFPVPFRPVEGYEWVFPTPKPAFNPVIQSAREIDPVKTIKGTWEQRWEVVRKYATKEEEDAAIEADRKSKVSQVVTARQIKLALLQTGLLDNIEAAVAQAGRAVKIEWEYATEFSRNWPTLYAMQASLGLTDRQLDDLFILAATL